MTYIPPEASVDLMIRVLDNPDTPPQRYPRLKQVLIALHAAGWRGPEEVAALKAANEQARFREIGLHDALRKETAKVKLAETVPAWQLDTGVEGSFAFNADNHIRMLEDQLTAYRKLADAVDRGALWSEELAALATCREIDPKEESA